MKKLIPVLLLLFACSDSSRQEGTIIDADSPIIAQQDFSISDVEIVVIPDITIDAWVDPCANLPNTHVRYCDCNPTCCQQQTWYCPPRGVEIQAKYAILDICGEDLVPCDRNRDTDCPPAEIIEETDCTHAFDCPPGINEDFTMYYDCEINGTSGTQQVRCDKGRLDYGECVTCFEEEEVCDFQDNDCDGEIDEGQRNACDGCGAVPEDICDGLDNDCDGTSDEQLIRECETICNNGLEVCSEGNWIGCTAQRPADEECDGEDNDCDNLVDEGLNCQCPPEMVGALVPCMEPPLICGLGFKTCECLTEECEVTQMTECFAACHWVPELSMTGQCDQLMGLATEPELCNNFDEDCDLLIDERLTRQCYTGPEGTLNVGVCAPGTQICNTGQWYGRRETGNYTVGVCSGETVPSQEVCDGADNDCDGVIDYGEEIPETDILFLVDWSGSMENYINAVRMAMNRFAQTFEAEDKLKWGLIVGPRILSNNLDRRGVMKEGLILEADISHFDDFLTAFSNVGQFDNQTGQEMFKDALLLSVRSISGNIDYDFTTAVWSNRVDSVPSLQDFKIKWRPNADRIIVLFTDEYDQTFLVPTVSDRVLLQALVGTPNLKTYIFAEGRWAWEDYATETGGRLFELSSNQEQMFSDLMSILDEICLSNSTTNNHFRSNFNFYPASYYHFNNYDFKLRICY
jgi:hypothetical protein